LSLVPHRGEHAKRRLIEGLRSILQRQEETDSDDDDGDSECLVYVKNYCTFATKLRLVAGLFVVSIILLLLYYKIINKSYDIKVF